MSPSLLPTPTQLPAAQSEAPSGATPTPRRRTARLLAPLDRLAESSRWLLSKSLGRFNSDGREYTLPRYLFAGPPGGGDRFRLGLFATLHGDEPEGALGLIRFLERLEANPMLAQGYALYVYPLCNPTGFEDRTRHSRRGFDLNREFWRESAEPEVRFLESEIWMHGFDGIVTLHSDDTSHGLYGFVRGHVLSEHLLQPALLEAGRHLPRNHGERIDGFPARSGIIHDGYPGMLQSAPGMVHPPFEITLETPQLAPLHRQVDALVAALETILVEYRYLQAIAQNI
ncbi:MAG: succinylglutamate desuccinylase/aspartoacylase family protein [Verrucomicrobiota bacterium]